MTWETSTVLLAPVTVISTGVGASVDLGTRDRLLRQSLVVTAANAGGTLEVRLESSPDGVGAWRPVGVFATALGFGVEKLTFISPDRYVRVGWKVAGTSPSFSLLVSGEKGIVYANLDDLEVNGMPSGAYTSFFPPSKRCDALASASVDADGKLSLRYDLPLQSWSSDLSKRICLIATYELMSARGFNPETGDMNVRDRFDDAWRWLGQVANSNINPLGIVDTTPTIDDDGPIFAAEPSRGWRR